jgi:glycosyltransferase involved in cell wall biosynthesis
VRVALDCRTVTAPKTGDRTYALGLTRALAALDGDDEWFLYSAEPTELTRHENPHCHAVVLPASPRWAWTPVAFPLDLRRRHLDLAHVQYLIPPLAPCPVVTTVHDVSFKRHPELFPLKHRVLLNLLIPPSLHQAVAVITCSEATRQDMIELYDLPPEKITVTPYAADETFRPMDPVEARRAVRERFGIAGRYLLAVGHIHPRKNLPRLVRAFNRISGKVPHELVLVGKQGWGNTELMEAISQAPVGREPRFTGYVADADLPVLYAGADAFAYPSLYEGFGLPPLEAMACGTPVLTSNLSSLPEVVGEAAVLVDPYDEPSLARALAELLGDARKRAALSAAGLARAVQFTWDATARGTLEVYRSVLQNR